jgi:hypothetical protein
MTNIIIVEDNDESIEGLTKINGERAAKNSTRKNK